MAKEFFLNTLKFLRQYPGILYSVSLLIIIPLVLYYNTFFVANSFQKSLDEAFRDQMIASGQLIEPFLAERLSNQELLQSYLVKVAEKNPDIEKFRVLAPREELSFEVLASKDPSEIGYTSQESLLAQAYSEPEGIVILSVDRQGERFWETTRPITDPETGAKVGLLTISLSMRQVDQYVSQTLFLAYLIVVGAIILSLFLIFHHTRLFEYVSLARRFQEIDKMKDNFIRMATHELQSPIINIRGHLAALKEELEGKLSSDQETLFKRANLSAKNLGELVSDILEVSRIEQGRLDMATEFLNPADIIKESAEELLAQAEQKGVKLSWQIPGQRLLIKVNANRLRQILANLIGNAVKYTNQGEVMVSVKADSAHKKYIISVTDTGPGIAAQDQGKLFQKFSRIKTAATAEIPGTGLGLWISREIARKMGGDIFLASMEGVGSTFTVIFPLAES